MPLRLTRLLAFSRISSTTSTSETIVFIRQVTILNTLLSAHHGHDKLLLQLRSARVEGRIELEGASVRLGDGVLCPLDDLSRLVLFFSIIVSLSFTIPRYKLDLLCRLLFFEEDYREFLLQRSRKSDAGPDET